MTLFDEFAITYRRRKVKRKNNDHGVFGVALQTLLDKDRKKLPNLRVPLIFQQLIQHLEQSGLCEEGLLRVSGRQARIKELRYEWDNAYNPGKPIAMDSVQLHDAAGLLKLFLRELPAPLLTLERVEAFIQLEKISDPQKQLNALNLLVLVLPEVNRDVLQMLLSFLRKVVDEPENRMTAENVAMVIAPNLFLASSGGSRNKPVAMDQELKLAAATSKVALFLLTNQDSLWTVPPTLMSQMRQKHEDAGPSNPIKKLLGALDKSDNKARYSNVMSDVQINVSLERSGADVKVPIDVSTTAGEVVELAVRSPRTRRRKQSSHQIDDVSSCFLFEVGGNIGERRLDLSANMMSVCQVNPNAKYVVRSQQE